jgi:3-oxo-5-alpha-steroid 4-dehydrogenase 1
MSYELFRNLIFIWLGLGLVTFLVLLKITAPYGRHTTSKWGPQINNRLGWVLMEIPGMILVMYYVLTNLAGQTIVTWTLVAFFMFHYINRTFIFPFRIHTRGKKMPVLIVGMAIIFNLVNGSVIGYSFGHFAEQSGYLLSTPHVIAGAILFIAGTIINWNYDNKLIHLRKPSETSYKIPKGGLFELVSCPNLLGEILEWGGFALMGWNLAVFSFFAWTLFNLLPRALSHHKWYQQKFENYPASRKAIIPYIL